MAIETNGRADGEAKWRIVADEDKIVPRGQWRIVASEADVGADVKAKLPIVADEAAG